MIRRIGRTWSLLVGVVAILALGTRWTIDECPMHAAAGVHAGHEMPVPQGPAAPCDCAEACALPMAVTAPPLAVGFETAVLEIPWRARSMTVARLGLGSHLRLPFATAPPRA
ncbi:MAG: hypothetical protein IPK85_08470 [Gemmatimonadetes bacterium]|nr:hypothetical protein [Gemmatimonadota bacterium]